MKVKVQILWIESIKPQTHKTNECTHKINMISSEEDYQDLETYKKESNTINSYQHFISYSSLSLYSSFHFCLC